MLDFIQRNSNRLKDSELEKLEKRVKNLIEDSFADMLAFKRYTIGITGLQYLHYPHGPVPIKYGSILELLEERNVISLEERSCGDCIGEIVTPQEEFDESVFTFEEVEILEYISKELGTKSASKLSDDSHKEEGYIRTEKGKVISYEFAEALSLD